MLNSDKRYLPRWEVKNRILYRLENDAESHECLSRDLNCTGACLMTGDPLPTDKDLNLTIYLNSKVSVDLVGQVIWNEVQTDGNLAGVVFKETKQSAQDLILEHAFEIRKKDLVQHWFRGWNPSEA